MIAFKRILVPHDFSDTSHAAVNYGIALARAFGARLHFLYFPRTAATAAAWDRLDPGRVSSKLDVNICYCSVFDECWGGDITEFTLHPKRVAKCTPSKTAYE